MRFSDFKGALVYGLPQPVELLDLMNDWASRVRLMAKESLVPDVDGNHWGMFDLANAYVMRDLIESRLAEIAPNGTSSDGTTPILAVVDDLLMSFTYEDEHPVGLKLVEPEAQVENWWWKRIPLQGVAKEEYEELTTQRATSQKLHEDGMPMTSNSEEQPFFVLKRLADLAELLGVSTTELIHFFQQHTDCRTNLTSQTSLTDEEVFEATEYFDHRPIKMWPDQVAPFGVLINAFVDGKLGPDEFQAVFIQLFKLMTTRFDPAIFCILEAVFMDSDAYVPEPWLRGSGPYDIDENELRARTALNLTELKAMVAQNGS